MSTTATPSAMKMGSMKVNMVLDDLVDEVEAVVVSFDVVDRDAVTILVEGTGEFWDRKAIKELVARADINVARWQGQVCTFFIKDVCNGVGFGSFGRSHVRSQSIDTEFLAFGRLSNWRECSDGTIPFR